MPTKKLLVVLAHPDDESFGPGGTLARYAHEGEVHLLCATRGEVGVVDDHLLQEHNSIADLRTAELECARAKLGVQGLHYLGYRDSGMPNTPTSQHPESLHQADVQEVAGKIVAYMRTFQPQVVLTFDQYGGYGHPDHIACHRATVLAFHAAGDAAQFPEAGPAYQPQKLYAAVFSKRIMRLMVRFMRLTRRDPTRFGRNQDINMEEIASWDVPITTRVDIRPWYEVKMAAAACHTSQGGGSGMWRPIPQFLRRGILGFETFYRMVPEFPRGGAVETDLFAGVQG